MASGWDYNCPKYVDFTTLDIAEDDGADDWFDINHEDEETYNKENRLISKLRGRSLMYPQARNVMADINKWKKRVSLPKKSPRVLNQQNEDSSRRVLVAELAKTVAQKASRVLKKEREDSPYLSATQKPVPENKASKTIEVPIQKLGSCLRVPLRVPKKEAKQEEKVKGNVRLLMTKPQPFKLTESKRQNVPKGAEYRSLAQQVIAFHRQTPKRFHTNRRKSSLSIPCNASKAKRATVPKTPNLRTKSRIRPVTARSKEDEEEQEWEDVQKQKFKAQPLNPRILNEVIGVKKVAPKELTQQKPFNLSSNLPKRKSVSLDNINDSRSFHARPVPAGLFEKPKGLGKLKEIPLTQPKTPSFCQLPRRRSQSADNKKTVVVKFQTPQTTKRNVSINGIPNQVKLEKRITTIEPFSFDVQDKQRFMKKEEKIKEFFENERKLRDFRAHPMPDLTTIKVPGKQVRPATEIQPFNFAKERFGAAKADKWKREVGRNESTGRIEDELEKQRQTFKARPLKVIPPFIPDRCTKPLTCFNNFELLTELRAVSRSDFDEQMKESQEMKTLMMKQREKQIEEEEKARLAKLRKDTVHKANPVRKYKPVDVKPSETPLTIPVTPPFVIKSKK